MKSNKKRTWNFILNGARNPWNFCQGFWRCAGHPSTSTTDKKVSKINEMIRENWRLTTREISVPWTFNLFYWNSYWRKIRTWDEWVRNLFHAFCHKNRKNSTCQYRWSCLIKRIKIQFFKKFDHWRRILGVRLRSWKQNAELSVENTELATSKESASTEIKCKSRVVRFLRYWRNCSSRVRASRYHSELEIT
jgi:hypothetical protein